MIVVFVKLESGESVEREFVTLEEVAAGLRLAPSTVLTYSSTGALPRMRKLPGGTHIMEKDQYLRARARRFGRKMMGRQFVELNDVADISYKECDDEVGYL